MNAEVPSLLGCRLPALLRGAPGPWGTATEADLVAFVPELALVPDARLAAVMRPDPAWAATSAGRSGRILVMPNGPFGRVDGPPSVQRLLGLRWLLSVLRPDMLAAAAMRAEVAGLPGLMVGVAADDAALDRLSGTG